MARVTRSQAKVAKPEPTKKTTKTSSNLKAKIAKDEAQTAETEADAEEDFQLPSDSESEQDSDDSDSEKLVQAQEEDSEVNVAEDKSSTINKAGHSITKPVANKPSSSISKANTKRGVIYIGRLPNGFEESELKQYFKQFGEITRLRLSRNKRSGNSKHYGFIEFKEHEVAKVASETMNNYLLMGHLLKCSLLDSSKINENLFVGANNKFKKIPYEKINKLKNDSKRSKNEWELLQEKHENNLKLKQEKLKNSGINFNINDL